MVLNQRDSINEKVTNDCKAIQPVHSEGDQPWDFSEGNDAEAETSTLATSCKELTHWKRLWCWEGLGAGGEGDDRGWDGWKVSLIRWTWVWVNSRSWWWTGRPGVLRFMGSQRVGHNWATELTELTHPQMVKDLPAMQETQVWSLDLEDPLEKVMNTHPSIVPGESQGQRGPVGYSPWGHKESD